jgi:hypothetical protein
MSERNLAKSLHTVTALVNVAKHVRASATMTYADGSSVYEFAEAVERAARILGVHEYPDAYGLKAQAVARLTAEAAIVAAVRA